MDESSPRETPRSPTHAPRSRERGAASGREIPSSPPPSIGSTTDPSLDDGGTTRPGRKQPSQRPTPTGATERVKAEPRTNARTTSRVDRTETASTRRARLATTEGAQSVLELEGILVLLGAMIAFPLVAVPVLAYFTDGTWNDRMLVGGSLLVFSGSAAAMFVRTRRAEALPRDAMTAFCAIAIAVAIPFLILGLGMATAATGLVAVGVLLLTANVSRRLGALAFVVVALGHAITIGLALRGEISTTGLGDVVPTPHGDLLLSGLFVVGEYTTAFALGSMLHGRWTGLLEELAGVMKTAAEREAMLREVREELARAENRVGPGRFTGHEFGSFRIGDLIGRGGMGEVYAATRISDGLEAAVKVLQRGMLGDRELVDRFAREARAVSSFSSPHVTAILEIGDVDSTVPYLAMERLRGQDLATILRNERTLPLSEVAVLVREVARGLDAAHSVGLVHRDLKPSNVFHATVDGARCWKILDFGIAKQTRGVEPTLTRDQILGTPQYMAPEQTTGASKVDLRADVHALAAIAYRALTGRAPFADPNLAALLVAVAHDLPVDPSSLVSLPPDVALVLRIGLAKRPDERPESALAFADHLDEAIGGNLPASVRFEAHRLLERAGWGGREELPPRSEETNREG